MFRLSLATASLLYLQPLVHCTPLPVKHSGIVQERAGSQTLFEVVFETETVPTTVTVTAGSTPTTVDSEPIYFLPPAVVPSAWYPTPNATTTAPATGPTSTDDPGLASNDTSNTPTDATRRPASGPLVMTYYPDWVADSFPPEKIDFSRFDWIDFAFAVPDQNYGLGWDGSSSAPDLLGRLVSLAHGKGKKVKLSIGGWTGSKYFSKAVANDQNRHVFVKNIADLYHQFNVDGIDIDWEYPGQGGNDGNIVSPQDSANFLQFLTLLRSSLPPTARITAATQTTPFVDQNGQPMKDVSAFAKVLDWILIMNYDVWGAASNPGPDAPLSDACHNSTQPDASADAAIRAWTGAGFPANQMTLGVPSYGYISKSSATRLRQRQLPVPDGQSPTDQGAPTPDNSTAPADDSSPSNGTFPTNSTLSQDAKKNVRLVGEDGQDQGSIQFTDLVKQGALCLAPGSSPKSYVGCGGFVRDWDACSSTPFLRSASQKQVISYDDPQSLGLKASLVKQKGLLGVNMFDVHGDTDVWDLVDSLRSALGVKGN